MKKSKIAAVIILSALTLCAMSGFTLGGSGTPEYPQADIPGLIAAGDREALRERYTAMYESGELTQEEYVLAKRWDWIVPNSEKIPLDDFEIDAAGIRTGTGWETAHQGGAEQ